MRYQDGEKRLLAAHQKQKAELGYIAPEIRPSFANGRWPTLMSVAIAGQIPKLPELDVLYNGVVDLGCEWSVSGDRNRYWESMEDILDKYVTKYRKKDWAKKIELMISTLYNVEKDVYVEHVLANNS